MQYSTISKTSNRGVLTLFRFHQYIKNLFVFAPLFFSFNFTPAGFLGTLIAFVLFSMVASSVYIFNDLMDINEDRNHPTKRFRPLASGAVSTSSAKLYMVLLSSSALAFSAWLNSHLFVVLTIYFLLNLAYSLKLKHITIIDIFVIATGFVLRLFAGAVVIGIGVSMWIVIMTFLLALFWAVAKLRDDVLLAGEGKATRKNIDGYNLEFVNAVMVFMSGVIVVAYILYTVSEDVIARIGSDYLYLTTAFVILGVMRYMQITFVEGNSGNPTKLVLKDRFLQLTILAWLGSFLLVAKL